MTSSVLLNGSDVMCRQVQASAMPGISLTESDDAKPKP